MFHNIYEKALKAEQIIRLQIFRMILNGVPRSGKTTFWKRLAIKDFQPSEISPSTGAAESHFISALETKESTCRSGESAHMCTEILFDWHLYSETDTSDLDNEAFYIYKHTLEHHNIETKSAQSKALIAMQESTTNEQTESEAEIATSPTNQSLANVSLPVHPNSSSSLRKLSSLQPLSGKIPTDSQPADHMAGKIDPVIKDIHRCCDKLLNRLKSGERIPLITTIKKLCHLVDVGGQRAFLEMLPTLSVGRALYLIFFSYEHFQKRCDEMVQLRHDHINVCTDTQYTQMEVILQSLICVTTSSVTSSKNVAMLVGTHADEVRKEDMEHINSEVHKHVESFLENDSLVLAEKDKLVLEVSIKPNENCSNDPEEYKKVLMNIVDKRLVCPESEKLPASWYMFSMVLRRLQHEGYSVLHYRDCEEIADRLHIPRSHLQSLLSRLHEVFGILMHFPEKEQLKDIVICDPSIIYRGISEFILDSFDTTKPLSSLRLTKLGIFDYEQLLEKHCKGQGERQLGVKELIIILEHLGIIAPVKLTDDTNDLGQSLISEYIIPCRLNDAPREHLNIQNLLQNDQACSIVPLRIYFKCGVVPMGGFCYLFSKLMTNKRWELVEPKICSQPHSTNENVYWRNKVTFKVEKYFVTLLSTINYYEIHITYSQRKSFELASEGHHICQKVWSDVSDILSMSKNKCLHSYDIATACLCENHMTIMTENNAEHIMIFNHDDLSEVTALCQKNESIPAEVDLKERQSLLVWFKVCYIFLRFLDVLQQRNPCVYTSTIHRFDPC